MQKVESVNIFVLHMMTSSNGNSFRVKLGLYFLRPLTSVNGRNRCRSALLVICAGNSPVPGEFPAQRPVTRGFDVFSDLRPNKWFSKQS